MNANNTDNWFLAVTSGGNVFLEKNDVIEAWVLEQDLNNSVVKGGVDTTWITAEMITPE